MIKAQRRQSFIFIEILKLYTWAWGQAALGGEAALSQWGGQLLTQQGGESKKFAREGWGGDTDKILLKYCKNNGR